MRLRAMFLVFFCCCAALAQTTTSSANKGAITGRVIGEDGQPLAGVSVSARAVQSGAASSRPALTDEDGYFRLTGLAPTAYTLRASLPAYVTTSLADAAGQSGPFHDGDSITIRMVKGGAITGKVINPNNEPIPGLSIKAIRLRDTDGKPLSNFSYSRRTDDRGVYRIFGLPAGTYIIQTNGVNAGWSWNADEQVEDASIYHPSSSRDTAAELTLHHGMDLGGIDIRYRDERGRRVSGKLLGASGSGFGVTVSLRQAGGVEILASDFRTMMERRPEEGVGFEIRGVADGEYDLVAERLSGDDDGAASQPRRIVVGGADLSGLELRLLPLASVTGKLSLAEIKTENKDGLAPDACAGVRRAVFEESTLTLLPETAAQQTANTAGNTAGNIAGNTAGITAGPRSATPSRQGDFRIRHLNAGRYRFDLQLPTEGWYVRAISQPNAQTKRTVDLARNGLAIKSGEKIKDVTVTVAEGAASLKGKVNPAEGKRLPANPHVHLIPAEKEAVDDVLRHFEVKVADDGAYAINHIAPGKYLMLSRTAMPNQPAATPAAWDSAERSKLRRAAEAANIVVEFQPCQRIKDKDLAGASPH